MTIKQKILNISDLQSVYSLNTVYHEIFEMFAGSNFCGFYYTYQ